jgi:hypothetical protein
MAGTASGPASVYHEGLARSYRLAALHVLHTPQAADVVVRHKRRAVVSATTLLYTQEPPHTAVSQVTTIVAPTSMDSLYQVTPNAVRLAPTTQHAPSTHFCSPLAASTGAS